MLIMVCFYLKTEFSESNTTILHLT